MFKPNPLSNFRIMNVTGDFTKFLITIKVSDASGRSRFQGERRIVDPVLCAGGATTEAYVIIRRKEERSKATRLELCKIPSWREDDALMVVQGQTAGLLKDASGSKISGFSIA